jgi:TrmH family RNA methyltransferase
LTREVIRSRSNREIREYAKLRQKKYRDREGLFLADGTKLLREALTSGIEPERICFTESWLEAADPELRTQVERLETERRASAVTPEVLELISSVKSPEGVVSVLHLPKEPDTEQLLSGRLNGESGLTGTASYVILEDVQDPGNLGTIIRTADAAGYDAVILTDQTADAFGDKALRASMGSAFHLPILRTDRLADILDSLAGNGFDVIGASLEGEPLDLCRATPPERLALVLGNESRGMTGTASGLCTRLVKIPIYGRAESLNVAVASGILLYAFAQK